MKTILMRFVPALFLLPVMLNGCTKEATVTSATDLTEESKMAASLDDATTAKATKTYVIEQGKHYANGKHFPLFSGTSLSFKAVFDNSAMYDFSDPKTKYDQNTLYGFADNNATHQEFSARFGWRWFNNELQIAAYTFNNGDSTIVEMSTVPLNKVSNYKIQVVDNRYFFTVNKDTLSLPRLSTTPTAGLYKLLPYFGGDAVAPHTVTIKIKEN